MSLTREELLSSGSKQEELRNQLHAIRETRDKVLTDLSQLLSELPAVPDANANAERDLAQELRVRIGLLEKHVYVLVVSSGCLALMLSYSTHPRHDH